MENHPDVKWEEQLQHLYPNTICMAAHALIISKDGSYRIVDFAGINGEFNKDFAGQGSLNTLNENVNKFDISKCLLFWIRLASFGCICSEYVEKAGKEMEFKRRPIVLETFLRAPKGNYRQFCGSNKKLKFPKLVVGRTCDA
ncbi:hypothetical protein A9Q83_04335 [Alphaproteobacteria bacterium 46_93_T64]|nr:hypothetical protein A9Q83_04335 [Alphaproteobacteria bacterium 46_93_T64]